MMCSIVDLYNVLYIIDLSMEGNTAWAQAVFIRFVTLRLVLSPLWTSEHSSVLNTTASHSEGGSTNGSPTQKWKVRCTV